MSMFIKSYLYLDKIYSLIINRINNNIWYIIIIILIIINLVVAGEANKVVFLKLLYQLNLKLFFIQFLNYDNEFIFKIL